MSAWRAPHPEPGAPAASLAARSTAPALQLTYGFTGAASPSCPTETNAGANTNRLVSTFTSGTAATLTDTYCYDKLDRLVAVLGANPQTAVFDTRGNQIAATTAAGTTVFVYDSAGRLAKAVGPNGSGGTVTVS